MKQNLSKILAVVYIFTMQSAGFCAQQMPAPAHSLRQSAIKFGSAMLGVIISSVVIYLGLSLYNKIFKKGEMSYNANSKYQLETPKNLKDAVNTFLDKTKWD